MAVDTQTLRSELRQFVVDSFLIGEEDAGFGDADSFMRSGIIDSTGILELTAFLEQRYGVTVEDNEMVPTNLDSIENLVTYLTRKLS
ncbi:MAG: acyl carrier protein [Candidatus Zixiibacteriota bacterium]